MLEPGDVRLVDHPGPLVPAGALTGLPDGVRLAHPVFAGEVVHEGRLAPAATSAAAARLPAGTRAVAVPREPATTPPLEVGDRVDVLVALGPEAAGTGAPGFALTTNAMVVDVAEAAVTVAVPRDAAPRLAVALTQGAVLLALTVG